MLARAAQLAIIAFWLVMTGLFVVSRWSGGVAPWQRVPPEHVVRLLFGQNESSELGLFSGRDKIGTLYVRPTPDAEPRLYFAGDFVLRVPMMEAQRVVFDGTFLLDAARQIRGLEAKVQTRNPQLRFEVKVDPSGYRYSVREKETVLASGEGSPDDLANAPELEGRGIDLERIRQMGRRFEAARVRAHRTQIMARGERLDVFRVVFEHAEGLATEVDVSMIGRVVRIQTPLGFHLAAEGFEPANP